MLGFQEKAEARYCTGKAEPEERATSLSFTGRTFPPQVIPDLFCVCFLAAGCLKGGKESPILALSAGHVKQGQR